ncbi:MAG: hypothetical protein L0312_24110 [Acidobacteria bacterium]|nr:hypothetical protein [Acidobacteriota bacterium]
MIVNHWPAWFRALYGGEWPRTYLCIDFETTGFSTERNVITEIGHCLVEDGEVTNQASRVLNWIGHPRVPDEWLRGRLNYVRQQVLNSGQPYHLTYERMRAEGGPPEQLLGACYKSLTKLIGRGTIVVTHNGYAFDERILASNLQWLGICEAFSFGDNGLFDTNCIEKANQAVDRPGVRPQAGDTLRSYFTRVKKMRIPGVRSNLADHCYKKYDFATHGVSADDMHGAGTDAYCVHLLMKAFRAHGPPVANTFAGASVKPKLKLVTPDEVPVSTSVRRRGQRNR